MDLIKKIKKDSFHFLDEEEIQKLMNDDDLTLNRERDGDDGDDSNVLYYLLAQHPDKGMKYGAKHGITRLFFAAKSEYFTKHEIDYTKTQKPAFEEYQNFIYNQVVDDSIRACDVIIFEDIVQDLRANQTINYTKALKYATEYNRKDMMKYCINKGANVREANALSIASKKDYRNLIDLLIKALRKQYEDDEHGFQQTVKHSTLVSIIYDKYKIFMLLLSHYDLSDIHRLLKFAILYNRMIFVSTLLTHDIVHDVNGELLKLSIRKQNIDMLQKLFNSLQYTSQTLINVIKYAVTIDDMISYDEHKTIIKSILQRINRSDIDYNHRDILENAVRGDSRIYRYLLKKFNRYYMNDAN
jgi:hypothetical protein